MLKHSRLSPSKHLPRDEGRGAFGVPPPLGIICQRGLLFVFFNFRRGSMFRAINPPRRCWRREAPGFN